MATFSGWFCMNEFDLKAKISQLVVNYIDTNDAPLLEDINLKYKSSLLKKLNACFDNLGHDKTEIAQRLKQVLADNWAMVKGSGLCYTAQPDDDITLLLCDIADFVCARLPESVAKGLLPIHYLMPEVNTRRSDTDDELAATQLSRQSLKTVLKTYILATANNYLIPIKQLPMFIENNPGNRFNVYYDVETMADDEAIISDDEVTRLTQHSADTLALLAAWQKLLSYQEESPSLLAKLDRLIRHLQYNSTRGIGQEENAASGAYQPIIDFFEFYKQLSDLEKEKIHEEVKKEIDLLFSLITDQSINIDATRNLTTCIASRRDAH